jgi:two-component system response regulator HydG
MRQSILIVDDEPPTLDLLGRILRDKTSYDVTTESNPLEVPRILERKQFDLLITDLGMRGMDGMRLLELVREQERFEEVVIITAFGSLDSVLEAVGLRVFDYLIKPFRKSQIVGVVERAMKRQRARRADARLRAICELRPYEQAERAFRDEYRQRQSAMQQDHEADSNRSEE